jgi:hypothetical protein
VATSVSKPGSTTAHRRRSAEPAATPDARRADSASSGSGRRFDPVISFDLPLALPVTDAEVRLVAAYLGDLITQILSEPE